MKKINNYILIIVFLGGIIFSAFTLKGYLQEENKDTIWVYFSNPDKKVDYYIEVNLDGDVILKYKEGKKTVIREGTIKKMYAKDFFRETKNSDLLNYSRNIDLTKMIFYKGDLIKISANIQGEIRRVISPFDRFSETFRYAFKQVYLESIKLPVSDKYVSFLYAAPLEGEIYTAYLKKVPSNYKIPIIETKDLKTNKYIFKAINNPWRIIPIPSKKEEGTIVEFMSVKNLYGVKSSFYIGTTRGNYQLSITE
ncbi:MAG: hypothetical protein K6357_06210 [Elusimicrobiota bacterium]